MNGRGSWKEIMNTEEARQIRIFAETQYKARRRSGKDKSTNGAGGAADLHATTGGQLESALFPVPETLWWDGSLCTSLPSHRASREDAPLVMMFLDVIHPLQFGFYHIDTAMDRSWLISSLCKNEARYHAALSVSASFIAGLSEPEKTDSIGLNPEVRGRQAVALRGLQQFIQNFEGQSWTTNEPFMTGMKILEVMHQLISLEVFSMIDGAWETHHRASTQLLGVLNSHHSLDVLGSVPPHRPSLKIALRDLSPDELRNIEFHITCFAWLDVIANATFGFPKNTSRSFDYIPLLQSNALKTQNVMGCHSSIMAMIAEITCLADWKASEFFDESSNAEELVNRANSLDDGLMNETSKLEQTYIANTARTEDDSRMVTLRFAYAARVYIHVVTYGANISDDRLASCVSRSLEMLESLPSRLAMRVCWAFTITGSMADETQYSRFRDIIARAAGQKLPAGMLWKGLMVMEECWRLRKTQPMLRSDCEWQAGMKSLKRRILLV